MKCLFEVNTICRLCLRVDEKVHQLHNTHHKAFINFIESIIKLKQKKYIPPDDYYVCYICSALLTKTFNFTLTIWNAQDLISTRLRSTNMITKSMLMNMDRQAFGLNPITLSSVVVYETKSNYGSCSGDDDDDLDVLTIKKDAQSKKNQKYDKNQHVNKGEDHSTNKKFLTSLNISSSSDEDNESDKFNLDEEEVEICNKPEENELRLSISRLFRNTTESVDPLARDLNTDVCDEPTSKKKKITVIKKKSDFKRKLLPIEAQSPESEDSSSSQQYDSKGKKIDEDYQPDSTSHSEGSDYELYNEWGCLLKRPTDNRVYPMKCDHCDYELPEKRNHYRHYQYVHPNIEYPYKQEKEYACSICGKLCGKYKIRGHELNHTTQNLKCTFCPKVYSNHIKWNAHLLRVHPKKTFTCDYCSKTLKTRIDMVRHIRTHTGSKPYKCHICGDRFAHSGNRTIHIRSKHQNLKYVPKKKNQTQKLRRNKHDSTDTEIMSSDEETVQRTKKNKTEKRNSKKNKTEKRNSKKNKTEKRNSKKISERTDVTSKKKRKNTKQLSKNKKVDRGDTALVLEDGQENHKRKKKDNLLDKNQEKPELESDDEILIVIKRKKDEMDAKVKTTEQVK